MRLARVTKGLAAGMLGAALAVSLMAGGEVSTHATGVASAEAAVPPGIGINGHYVNRVLLNGKFLSLQDYGVLEARANATGSVLNLMVDTSAIGRGYMVAFTSESESAAYLNAIPHARSRSTKKIEREPLLQAGRVMAGGMSSLKLGDDRVGLMTCATSSQPTHQAYLFADTACGGSIFVAIWDETEANLGTYGWSNRISSMIIGDCIPNLRAYDNTGASGGASRNFGNSSGHTTYSSIQFGGAQNWSDRISSYTTDVQAPC